MSSRITADADVFEQEDDTEGTCSPSLAREIATRSVEGGLGAGLAARLLSSSDISTL